MRDWQDGLYAGADDPTVLAAAYREGFTLITFDLRTIVPLLRQLGEQGVAHAGVVLIDERTIPPNDTRILTRSLCKLWDATNADDWTNRVVYLTR